jgi:hypothetical protein
MNTNTMSIARPAQVYDSPPVDEEHLHILLAQHVRYPVCRLQGLSCTFEGD